MTGWLAPLKSSMEFLAISREGRLMMCSPVMALRLFHEKALKGTCGFRWQLRHGKFRIYGCLHRQYLMRRGSCCPGQTGTPGGGQPPSPPTREGFLEPRVRAARKD